MLANTFTMNWWLEREIQIQKLLDYEQSLFFFRFREGGRACAPEQEMRVPLPSRAFCQGHGHFHVSCVSLNRIEKKRDYL